MNSPLFIFGAIHRLGSGLQVTLERAAWLEDGGLLESDSSAEAGVSC